LVLRETTIDDLPILFEHQRDPVANEVAVFAARDWDAFVANDAKIVGRTRTRRARIEGAA